MVLEDAGAVPGALHAYFVVASDGLGQTAASNTATLSLTVPVAPAGLVVTGSTAAGDSTQASLLALWLFGEVPDSYADPVCVDVPVLLISGTHDPVTPPRWGAEAARHLPDSLHVVVPGGHGVGGREVRRLERAFLERGSVEGLDLSEVQALELPPLVLP